MALAGVQDQARAHRMLWAGFCVVIAGVHTVAGAAYLVGGIRVADSSEPYKLLLFVPGGMHVWGLFMFCAGLALLHGLLPTLYGQPALRWWLRRALIATFALSFLLVWEFVGSWWLTGALSVLGVILWSAFAVLSVLLVKLPPPVATSETGSGGSGRA